MRICQITLHAYDFAGLGIIVYRAADELTQRGHEVLTIATDAKLGDRTPIADIVIPAIGGSALTRLRDHLWYHRAYKHIRRAVEHFKPDVVHLHTTSPFSPSVFAAVRGIPTLLFVHGPETFTLRLLPWFLPAWAYRHGSYKWEDLTPAGRLLYLYMRYLLRPAHRLGLRRVSRVLCASEFYAEALACDVPHDIVHVLPYGIRLPEPRPLPSDPVVLFVGRLECVKGADVLLRALPAVLDAVPGARLEIVGDGPERTRLTQLAVTLGLTGRVSFKGWVTRDELLCAYERAAVVVVPSIWHEAFGLVAVEASGTGRPVVASAVGGLAELVDDDVTGYLVPPYDATALANALIRVLGDPDRARRMGQAAAKKAQAFRLDPFVDELEAHYRAIVN